MSKQCEEILVQDEKYNQYGYICRRPTHQKEFGNFGAIEYSVCGKRYWSVGGKQIVLPLSVIKTLQKNGELK
jgi:hypothetical protein